MLEDVVIAALDGPPVALEGCEKLTTDELVPSGGGRAFSSRLYASHEWRAIRPPEVSGLPDPLNGTTVTRFQLPRGIVTAVSDRIFGSDDSVAHHTADLSEELVQALSLAVTARLGLGRRLTIRRRLKPIASLPSAGVVAGNTTDGLHFDAVNDTPVLRVGLNLGPASRFVHCGLTSLRQLREILGAEVPAASVTHAATYDYGLLADAGLRVVRFEVQSGFGWLMETTNVLHDGRRAHPSLPSRFVLMEATVELGE